MKLILLLMICLGLSGQQQNTIYKVLGTNVVTTGVVSTIPNIGQGFHQLSVTPKNITANSCDGSGGWGGNVVLQGSYTGSDWVTIGFPIVKYSIIDPAPANRSMVITGQGPYSYLRVNYISGSTSTCGLNFAYSANIFGSAATNTISAVNEGFITTNYTAGMTASADSNIISPTTCYAINGVSRLVIYDFLIINLDTAAMGDVKVEFRLNGANSPLTSLYTKSFNGLPAGKEIHWGNSPRPAWISMVMVSSGDAIDLRYTKPAGSKVNIFFTYRCE